jgi:TetR/AcrR family transcriptional repressor of uid operon
MRSADPALHERRRAQILDAARLAFVDKGFHQTSMADLAKGAGVSMGLLYRYFSSKDDIVTHIAEREREASLARIQRFADAEDWRKELDNLAGELIEEAFDPHGARLSLEVAAEASRNPRLLAMLRAEDAAVQQSLAAAIRQHKKRGTMSPHLDAALSAELVAALFDGLIGRALANPSLSRRSLRRGIVQMIGRSLGDPD